MASETLPGTNRRVNMLKLVYALRIIAAVLAVGAMGSLQLDVIDFWTWFCQTMLGVTLWILAGYWLEDIHELEKKSPLVKS